MEQTFKVEGMSCQGCANSIQTLLDTSGKVQSAKVDLENERVTVDSDMALNLDDMNEIIADTPYDFVEEV